MHHLVSFLFQRVRGFTMDWDQLLLLLDGGQRLLRNRYHVSGSSRMLPVSASGFNLKEVMINVTARLPHSSQTVNKYLGLS